VSEPSDRWRNWAGDESCIPAAIVSPRSVEEVAAAIGQARERGLKVRVAGAGHSFGDNVCTDGMLLRLDALSRVLQLDAAAGVVSVEAGISIRALNAALAAQGLAFENLGDIDSQSLAGAISTATHGTGARLGNIPSQVLALTLVLADGSTLRCSRNDADPELFKATVVSLGALGVIVEVTLNAVPAFTLRAIDATAPLEATLDRFEELSLGNDHFELYAFPYAPLALTRTNNRTDLPPRPRARAVAYAEDILLNNELFGALCRLGRRFPGQIPRINRLVTRLAAGRRVRIDRSHAIFASPRHVRFTEMEYSLPRARTPEAVRAVMSLIDERRLPVPFPIEVRSVAADDAFLSTATSRDSGYVAVHMFEGMGWRPYFEAVEEIMLDLEGRPHWGKRHFQAAETLRERYPDWDRFASVRARLDPTGLFANAWTDRVLGPVERAAAMPSSSDDGTAETRSSSDGEGAQAHDR
jgi:L-gulono-1,4-lactone dehydrogenase